MTVMLVILRGNAVRAWMTMFGVKHSRCVCREEATSAAWIMIVLQICAARVQLQTGHLFAVVHLMLTAITVIRMGGVPLVKTALNGILSRVHVLLLAHHSWVLVKPAKLIRLVQVDRVLENAALSLSTFVLHVIGMVLASPVLMDMAGTTFHNIVITMP